MSSTGSFKHPTAMNRIANALHAPGLGIAVALVLSACGGGSDDGGPPQLGQTGCFVYPGCGEQPAPPPRPDTDCDVQQGPTQVFSASFARTTVTITCGFHAATSFLTVPSGIIGDVTVTALGGAGATWDPGNSPGAPGMAGGGGASVTGGIRVLPGTKLEIRVGGMGTMYADNRPDVPGWNGGGAEGSVNSAPGGGASDVRIAGGDDSQRLVVAGGGGGGAYAGAGGAGGLNGSDAALFYFDRSVSGGRGGTQTNPGAGGDAYAPGAVQPAGNPGQGSTGGDGWLSAPPYYPFTGGGGGGGGYRGGGGGGACGTGGGGGSSYLPPNAIAPTFVTGANAGNGQITFTYVVASGTYVLPPGL